MDTEATIHIGSPKLDNRKCGDMLPGLINQYLLRNMRDPSCLISMFQAAAGGVMV